MRPWGTCSGVRFRIFDTVHARTRLIPPMKVPSIVFYPPRFLILPSCILFSVFWLSGFRIPDGGDIPSVPSWWFHAPLGTSSVAWYHHHSRFFGICLVLPACLQRFILYPGDNTYVTLFNFWPPVGSHIPFSGRLCMSAPSVCFWTL